MPRRVTVECIMKWIRNERSEPLVLFWNVLIFTEWMGTISTTTLLGGGNYDEWTFLQDGVNWLNTTSMYSFNMRARRRNYIMKIGNCVSYRYRTSLSACTPTDREVVFQLSALAERNNLSSLAERWKLDNTTCVIVRTSGSWIPVRTVGSFIRVL